MAPLATFDDSAVKNQTRVLSTVILFSFLSLGSFSFDGLSRLVLEQLG